MNFRPVGKLQAAEGLHSPGVPLNVLQTIGALGDFLGLFAL